MPGHLTAVDRRATTQRLDRGHRTIAVPGKRSPGYAPPSRLQRRQPAVANRSSGSRPDRPELLAGLGCVIRETQLPSGEHRPEVWARRAQGEDTLAHHFIAFVCYRAAVRTQKNKRLPNRSGLVGWSEPHPDTAHKNVAQITLERPPEYALDELARSFVVHAQITSRVADRAYHESSNCQARAKSSRLSARRRASPVPRIP